MHMVRAFLYIFFGSNQSVTCISFLSGIYDSYEVSIGGDENHGSKRQLSRRLGIGYVFIYFVPSRLF